MDEDYNPSNAKSKPPKELSETHATKKVSEKKSETTSSSSHKSKEKSSAVNNTDKKNYSFKLVPGSNKNLVNNSPKSKVVADHSSTESIKQILNGESVGNNVLPAIPSVTTESNHRNKNFPRSMDRSAPTTPTSQKPTSPQGGTPESIAATSQPPATITTTSTTSSTHVPPAATSGGGGGSPAAAAAAAVVPNTTTTTSLSLAKKIEVSTPKSGNFDVLGSIMKDMQK